MSDLRRYIGDQANDFLWTVFEEIEIYEKTGTVDYGAHLRSITNRFFGNELASSMHMVCHEVFRELAVRGAKCTL